MSHRHYVFTIPRALRGLFERERALLELLARLAYEAVRKTVASALERKDAVPGFVGAIQTFGAFGPNFHPHVHAIVTEGAWSREGEFLPCDAPAPSVIEEVFRREVLARLHRAERLSDAFLESLLSWTHSGFSVYAQQAIAPDDSSKLERLARYATRSPIRLDAVEKTAEGKAKIATPRDPRTGTSEIVLDPLDGVRAITSQIPDPRRHLVRYYGAYACRTRGARRRRSARGAPRTGATKFDDDTGPATTGRDKQSWARLLGTLLEVDPLVCGRARAWNTMRVFCAYAVTGPKPRTSFTYSS